MLTELALEVRVEYDVPDVESVEEDNDNVNELDKGVENWLVEDETVEDGVLLDDDEGKEIESDEGEEDELMDFCAVEGLGVVKFCPVEELELVELCTVGKDELVDDGKVEDNELLELCGVEEL